MNEKYGLYLKVQPTSHCGKLLKIMNTQEINPVIKFKTKKPSKKGENWTIKEEIFWRGFDVDKESHLGRELIHPDLLLNHRSLDGHTYIVRFKEPSMKITSNESMPSKSIDCFDFPRHVSFISTLQSIVQEMHSRIGYAILSNPHIQSNRLYFIDFDGISDEDSDRLNALSKKYWHLD